MRKRAGLLLSLAVAAGGAGCGDERETLEPPRAQSSRVALTVSYPGLAPWALITYQTRAGERCHALGTLTTAGPRVLGAADEPLETALAGNGRCLDRGHAAVSLDVSDGARGAVRIVGGLVARGVRRLVVAGERVRPSRSGAFLVSQPSSSALGESVHLVYESGATEQVALEDARRRVERE